MHINVTYDASVSGAPAEFTAAVAAAVAYYESNFDAPVTVNITIGWGAAAGFALPQGALGATSPAGYYFSYQQVRNALWSDAKTADALTAAMSLPAADPTNGGTFFMTSAQAKALHLISASDSKTDGTIVIDPTTDYTFDPNNRAVAGKVDFIGVLEHEIGHVLGRISELGRTLPDGRRLYGLPDLFRYSSPGVLAPTATNASFSINGQNLLLPFNDPSNGGDADDWSIDHTGDAFDAFADTGVQEQISNTDRTMLDVFGFHPKQTMPDTPGPGDSTISLTDANGATINVDFSFVQNNSIPSGLYGYKLQSGPLTNSGTVASITNNGNSVAAFYVSPTPVSPSNVFTNSASGAVMAEALGSATSYAFYYGTLAPQISNAGLIQSVSQGVAYGIKSLSTFDKLANANGGTLRAWGGNVAIGVYYYNGGQLQNAGLIEVTGANGALGVVGITQFDNSGIIRATSSRGNSVAVDFYGHAPAGPFTNSGTIIGDYSFWVDRNSSTSPFDPDVNIVNSGKIIGAIQLANGVNQIHNTGIIAGYIKFGDSAATYDGAGGHLYGDIYLGHATNTVTLGPDGGTVFGGGGADTITGGAGNDTFVIQGGANHLDGKGGTNTLSLTGATSGYVVDLGQGKAVGADISWIANIQQVFGSAFGDTLVAGNASARFVAGGGSDVLRGGAGNDTLLGGAGSDTLTGGPGADALDGGRGWDRAVYSAAFASYTISHNGDGSYTVSGPEGTDTLTGIEELVFSDKTVAIGSMPSADMNGLGRSDLVWQNVGGQPVVWLMNGPTVLSQVAVGSNPGPAWHVKGTGDFDGDGNADILWQNDNGQAVIWLMNGTTMLNAAAAGENPGPGWHVAATNDFDGDGKADILWQNDSGQAAIWLMNGTTVAGSGLVGGNPGPSWHVKATGDFDGDGKSDILWQNDNGQAAIWLMNGSGVAGGGLAGANPGPGWHVVGAGDFNGDFKSDIVWQNDSGQAAIWLMNGSAMVGGGAVGSNPGANWHIKGTADLNGDSKVDILWQCTSGQAMGWLMNGTTVSSSALLGSNPGSNWQIANYGSVARAVPEDFDVNHMGDILWQNDSGQAAIWLMSGTSQVGGGAVSPNPSPSWHVIAARDFDGDLKSDILWQNDSGQVAIWFMDAAGLKSGAVLGTSPDPSWHAKATGDFDGDGKSDILWQNDSGQAAIWQMNSTTIAGAAAVGSNPGPSWHIRGAGDFDGDGKSDILWQNDNGQAVVWLMNGASVVSADAVRSSPGTSWHVMGAGDFNGDGKSDILWQNDNGQAHVWLMNGTTATSTVDIGSNPGASWHVKGTADLNGDGLSDILWQNDNGQAVGWLMSGTNVLSSSAIGPNPGPSWHLIASGG